MGGAIVTTIGRRGEVIWLLARDGGYLAARLETRQFLAMVTKVRRVPCQCRTAAVCGIDNSVRRDFYIGFPVRRQGQLAGFMPKQTESTYRASRSGFDFLGVISAIVANTLVETSGMK